MDNDHCPTCGRKMPKEKVKKAVKRSNLPGTASGHQSYFTPKKTMSKSDLLKMLNEAVKNTK